MGFNTFPCNPYPISTEELNKGNNDDLNTRVAALESDVSDLNSNKANQITIAPFFNAETAYTAGDMVYYNGLSYRCTNDHEGEWDADDFAATTIENELAALKNGLTNYISVGGATLGEDTAIVTGNVELQFSIPPKTGYAPIGVCGYNFQNRILMSALSISGFAINNGICYVYGYTASNATVPNNARIDILYAKSI